MKTKLSDLKGLILKASQLKRNKFVTGQTTVKNWKINKE